MLENVSFILGIELMHCLQAVDLVGKEPSRRLGEIAKAVRGERVEFIEEDSYFGPQITKAK